MVVARSPPGSHTPRGDTDRLAMRAVHVWWSWGTDGTLEAATGEPWIHPSTSVGQDCFLSQDFSCLEAHVLTSTTS